MGLVPYPFVFALPSSGELMGPSFPVDKNRLPLIRNREAPNQVGSSQEACLREQ